MSNSERIAEFMGYKYYKYPLQDAGWRKEKGHLKISGYYLCRTVKQMRYCVSWDWLMPVGKKILDITSNQDRPNVNACNNLDWLECQISCHIREYNIEEAFKAIVVFIEAYNANKVLTP